MMPECIEDKCKNPAVENNIYCQEHLPDNPELTTYNLSHMDSTDPMIVKIIEKEIANTQEDN
ncbi:MAG: hypothetical protein QNJ42_15795 [Crocosphaera sp.]|nr:hypothetical protein [Crocosphaera sp.]